MGQDRPADDRARRGLGLVSTTVRAFAGAATDYHRLLDVIVRNVAAAIPDTCVVTLWSEDARSMTPVAVYDPDPSVRAAFDSLIRKPHALEEAPLAAEVIERGSLFMPRVDLQALQQRMPAPSIERLRTIGVSGLLVVPIQRGGELYGVLTVMRRKPEHAELDELDLEIVEDLAGHAALAIGNARLFARLQDELARRAEAELALEVSERLRKAEERAVHASLFLDTIVEHIPDMVFVKDAERLAFVRFNRAGEELLGMTRAELVGKTDFDFFPRSEAEFFVAKDRETLNGKKLVDIPEESIQTRRGMRWLHTKKVPIVDADGTPRYLLGISHDITDQKLAAAKLSAAREATASVNQELESFAYSVAHDLRAPLRGILGHTLAVIEDDADKLPEEGRHHLDRVRESAERMALLIDELLKFSRVTQVELVPSRVDLTAIAHSTMAGLQHSDVTRRVEVVIQPGLAAYGDPHLLALVLENLFDNSWKFTSKRDQARIELGSTIRDGHQTFFVRDNGAGFDMQYADQLFGVFHRLHRSSEFPGVGIGLATVARIIHRHHGRVWGDSVVGEGATFYFTIGTLGEPP